MKTAADLSSDAELLEASRAGELHAFGGLVQRYQNLVCAVAYSRTGDRVTSEDVGQQTFLAAWSGLDSIREPSQLRAWLCSVARNLSGKAVRARQRELSTDSEALDAQASSGSDPLAKMISHESEAAVWEALAELPDTYREPLVLFYREDQSIKQVALGLGISEDAAKQRLSRGRQALKAGVSDLVERTLHTSRPNRAFVAGVLGAVEAGPLSPAGASTAKAAGLSTKVALIGAAVAALVVAAIAFAVPADEDPHPPDQRHGVTTAPDPDRELLAHLRQRRQALRAQSTSPPGCALEGSVTDLEGSPVPNAIVALVADSVQASALNQHSVRSDTEGRWSSGPLDGPEFLVSVTAPGYLAATTVRRCDAGGGVDILLTRGGTRLRGVVEDLTGGPVEGASLWILPTTGNPNAAVSTTTEEDGSYDVSVLPDRYTLLASHPDYVLSARQSVLSADEAAEDFVLLPGASIEGVITERTTGLPVEGASVTTSWSVQETMRSNTPAARVFASILPAVSDADGRYRLNGLPPGPVRVTARTPELVTTDLPGVELSIAETKSGVDVEVGEAFSVSGFVIAHDGSQEGLAGLGVVLVAKNPRPTSNIATTDESGFYEISGVEAGTYALLVVGGEAAPQVANENITVTDDDVGELLSRVDRGVSVRGRVDSPERASIHLEPAGPGATPLTVAALALARPQLDPSGGFSFPAVAAGDYIVVAKTLTGEGRLPLTVRTDPLTDLRIDIAPLGRVEGELTGPAGEPVADALVVAQPRGVPAIPASTAVMTGQDHTDADGRFELVGLTGGDYDITVFDEVGQRPWTGTDPEQSFEPRRVEVPASGSVRFDLRVQTESARLRGNVVDSDGAPVADAWIQVRAQGSTPAPFGYEPRPTLTDSEGEFGLEGVFGSAFEIRANGPRGNLEANTTSSANDAPVTLVLAAVSTVVASVTENGAAAQDFELRVSDGPTQVLGPLVERTDGAFVLPRLQSGDYRIEVATETSYVQEIVSVGPDPETSVELELEARGSVHGLAVDTDGTPAAGGKVMNLELEFSLRRPMRHEVPIAEDGTFEFAGLRPGRGKLMVLGPGDKPDFIGSVVFELKPGADLDLGTLQPGKRPSMATAPFLDTSLDLGLRFFVGPRPPTAEQLRAIDDADDPRQRVETEGARLWVAEVTADGPAARAGLRPGDAVLAVGRMRVGDEDRPPADAMISLSQDWRSKGRSVTWVLERDDRRLELPVLVPARRE